MAQQLTNDERAVLRLLCRSDHPVIRSEELKAAVLTLADRQLVCDPHKFADGLVTMITEAGRAAAKESA